MLAPAPPTARAGLRSTGKPLLDATVQCVTSVGKELTCTICMSLMKTPVLVPCTHAFCRACLAELMQKTPVSKSPQCPQCRAHFNRRDMWFDDTLSTLVDIYKRIHPSAASSVVQVTQVASFTQLAVGFATQAAGSGKPLSETQPQAPPTPTAVASTALPMQLAPMRDESQPLAKTSEPPPTIVASQVSDQSFESAPVNVELPAYDTPLQSRLHAEETPVVVTPPYVPTPATVLLSARTTTTTTHAPDSASPVGSARAPRFVLDSGRSRGSLESFGSMGSRGSAKSVGSRTPLTPVAPAAAPLSAAMAAEAGAAEAAKVEEAPAPLRLGALEPNLAAHAERRTKKSKTSVETTTAPDAPPEPTTTTTTPEAPTMAAPPEKKDPFRKDKAVTVLRRMGPGENKPGGVAMVLKNHGDGFIDVKYTVNGTTERRVDLKFVLAGIHVESDARMTTTPPPPPQSSSAKRADNDNDGEVAVKSSSRTARSKRVCAAPAPTATTTTTTTTARGPVILISGRKPRAALFEAVASLGGTLCETDDDDASAWTHCVAFDADVGGSGGDELTCPRSLNYLRAVSLGLWVVTPAWLHKCVKRREWVPEAPFEIAADATSHNTELAGNAPRRARECVALQKAQGGSALLFHGLTFALLGRFSKERSELDWRFLISNCGGQLVSLQADDDDDVKDSRETVHVVCKDLASAHAGAEWPQALKLLQRDDGARLLHETWLVDAIASYTVIPVSDYVVAWKKKPAA